MVIVLFGVSGCGKTTIGQQLADLLNWSFIDADDFHPLDNIEKMRQGQALNDKDRQPWLEGLGSLIAGINSKHNHAILACSALKQSYRELLGVNEEEIKSVLLDGSFEAIQQRLQQRSHQFMNDDLLRSQFDSLEKNPHSLAISISDPIDTICHNIMETLHL